MEQKISGNHRNEGGVYLPAKRIGIMLMSYSPPLARKFHPVEDRR